MLKVNNLNGFGFQSRLKELWLQDNQIISNTVPFTLSSNIQKGDLIVICNWASNTSGTAPSIVIPSGYTSIEEYRYTPFPYVSVEWCAKIATSSDAGSSVTTMNGSSSDTVYVMIFRGNVEVKEFTHTTAGSAFNSTTARTITTGSQQPVTIALALYRADSNRTAFSFVPTQNGSLATGTSETRYKVFNVGDTMQDVVIRNLATGNLIISGISVSCK